MVERWEVNDLEGDVVKMFEDGSSCSSCKRVVVGSP